MANRLQHEPSLYLLQHAHNPVDWFPWGPEALERARAEDRPIFLSIGYSACHWCHVMERESFENPHAAALLNQHFVAIKVDREERPDLDELYMTAVQLLTGQGGWPLSIFLTPEGRPFYGGTYFPLRGVPGRIGFLSLLTQLAEAWEGRRTDVEAAADEITEHLVQAARQRPIAVSETRTPEQLLAQAVADLAERFDSEYGGFGGAPKFPPHHAMRLLTLAAQHELADAPQLLIATLDAMACGGIYDQVGGGFHRYSTDRQWLLPHFEKMLYDNALLARVYADAYSLTGRVAYARIARETCDWVLETLTDPHGGFQSALDADSEGEEGRYYVWNYADVAALADTAFCDQYQVLPDGNFHEEATRRPTGHNILHLVAPLPEALSEAALAARDRLRAQRAQRVPPQKDNKVITAWNGLMIGALARTGAALEEPRYLAAARAAATFCTRVMAPEGALLHRAVGGVPAIPAFLDDYVYLADGLLDLADATHDEHWRTQAQQLAATVRATFWDEEDSGFFYTGTVHHEPLIARPKELFDGALPSPNGVAVRVLLRLGGEWAAVGEQVLERFHGVLQRAPQGMATWIEAAAQHAQPTHRALRLDPPAVLHLTPGSSAAAHFRLILPPGWHLNDLAPDGGIALEWGSDLPAAIGPVQTEGAVFSLPVAVAADATPGRYHLTLTATVMVCTESTCLPPEVLTARVRVWIADVAPR